MSKYHIGENGPAVCRASKRPCPVGGDHFDSQEEAVAAFEASMGSSALEGAKKTVEPTFVPSEAFTKKYDSNKERIAAYQKELEDAVAGLADDDNWQDYLDSMSKFHSYSLNNQIMIMLQTKGQATRVAGFKAWKNDFERTVKKGEKGIAIFAPQIVKKQVQDPAGNPVFDDNGKPVKRPQIVGFRAVKVFDVSQTEGKPLPSIQRELSEEPPEGFVEDMTKAAEKAGFQVEYEERDSINRGTSQGYTSPSTKKIVIDSSLSKGMQAKVLAHELGHVYAGHCENLDKYHTREDGCRGQFEVEAESIAYALTRSQGMSMDTAKVSSTYVAAWSRKDPTALQKSAETVSKAVGNILKDTNFRNSA